MQRYFCLFLLLCCFSACKAQLNKNQSEFTRADTLRGSLRPERTCYDVTFYHLNIKISPDKKYLEGYNDITFKVINDFTRMQVDLFDNMQVDKITYKGKNLGFTREYNAIFIQFPKKLKKGRTESIRFYYSGYPITAKRAPWDGGFVWTEDAKGKPWVAVACQGTGASLWWPNKDHQSDEPDSMLISVAVPNGLMNVSNGRFVGKKEMKNGFTQWNWQVNNPINNYDVTVNIADYAHFSDKSGDLDLNYYVLKENLAKAKKQFGEVKPMMQCFQQHFGEYPFMEDGYKLVETPYLGMEHQSAVAYGNKYKNGYLGRDLSGTGLGLKWDFIIIHESGHEWFGNSITAADIADMWIHESFTTYSESVYHECRWGYEEAMQYLNGIKKNVQNDEPIIGPYGVNEEGSGDMYYKGALMLNTIRHIVNNDDKWWAMLKKYCLTFKHQIISTPDVIRFFEKESGLELEQVFKQYLCYTHIPVLQVKYEGNTAKYRWKSDINGFSMPLDVFVNGEEQRIYPTTEWQSADISGINVEDIKIATEQFYIEIETE